MNTLDKQYIDLLNDILKNGTRKSDRTGVGTTSVSGRIFQHDMSEGFPVLTTKRVYFKTMSVELEGFLKGITDKQWFKDRKCNIWNDWSNPKTRPEGVSQEDWNDLGPLGYSFQLRNFNGQYKPVPQIITNLNKVIEVQESDNEYVGKIIDGKYGKFTVISYDGKNKHGNPKFTVKFHKTGYIKSNIETNQINTGNIKDLYFPNVAGVACLGDYNKELLGEEITNKLLQTWNAMIQRCYNKNHKAYKNYGAKGVYVHSSWLIFENYLNDIQELDNWNNKLNNWNEYQLDKDLNGGFEYSKEKCIWITRKENNNLTAQNYYFNATDPDGLLYENEIGLSRFCKLHNLDEKSVHASITNNTKTHNGWKFYRKEQYKNYKEGFDQLSFVLDQIENNPTSRRIISSAWNPLQLDQQALPPCHYSWQVIVRGDYLDMLWNQRSVDCAVGLPFDIASYGLLLSLLAYQFGYKPGVLTGFLGDTHIYNNHHEQVAEQIARLKDAYELPQLKINDSFKDVREFNHSTDVELINYKYHPPIKAPIAV